MCPSPKDYYQEAFPYVKGQSFLIGVWLWHDVTYSAQDD